MTNVDPRAPVQAPAFIHLLARVADTPVPSAGPRLAERLGQWIDWNRAVTLSRALDGRLPDAPDVADVEESPDAQCARVRASLVEAITTERGLALPDDATAVPEYAAFRGYCVAMQRAMQAATGRLRGELRDRLARCQNGRARLAELDAVMEQTLSPREQQLLSGVPVMLGEHFERLRPAPLDPAVDAPAARAWLAIFRRDLQDVLLAELDVRFQPLEGLLAALRTA